jgi:hypothetical protein
MARRNTLLYCASPPLSVCASGLCRARCGLPTTLLQITRNCYICDMTTAEDIAKAVERLAPRELAHFRVWFDAFDATQFDATIDRDTRAGKLDTLADEALAAHGAGRSREL